jgi:multisubunit Na+/H+ antiporter MnhB subunit
MTGPLTRPVARVLLPTSLVTAVAILIKGYADAGDGFAAGAVAATGVIVQYVAFGARAVERLLPVRLAPASVVVGLLLALAVTFAPVIAGRPLLSHAPAPGAHVVHIGILELHTAMLFDVGVFLVVLGFAVGVMRTIARTPQPDS